MSTAEWMAPSVDTQPLILSVLQPTGYKHKRPLQCGPKAQTGCRVIPYSVLTSALEGGGWPLYHLGRAQVPIGRGRVGPRASPERLYSTQSCMNVNWRNWVELGGKSLSVALKQCSYEQLLLAAVHHVQSANAKTNYANTLWSGLQFHRITMESK
jgi:hypothetical protein